MRQPWNFKPLHDRFMEWGMSRLCATISSVVAVGFFYCIAVTVVFALIWWHWS